MDGEEEDQVVVFVKIAEITQWMDILGGKGGRMKSIWMGNDHC